MYRRKHIGNCSSGHCIVITDDLTDRINSCFLFCIIATYCNGKQGIGVFVPGFYGILIRKFQWFVDINGIIQPGNFLNAFGFFYFFFVFQCIWNGYVINDNPHIGDGLGIFLFHNIQCIGRWSIFRKIIRKIIIHPDQCG